jgi:acyl-CoA thioesterase YciA
MPMPADANQNGDIFGGWIMAQVDIAGGTVAGRKARGRVATVAVKEFVFKQPVQIGDLLSFYVDVVRVGNTSITVNVEVYAERRPSDPKVVKVTEATLTYVAIDRDGRPRCLITTARTPRTPEPRASDRGRWARGHAESLVLRPGPHLAADLLRQDGNCLLPPLHPGR